MAVGLPLELHTKIGQKNLKFLIDTGSSISLLPYDNYFIHNLKSSSVSLSAANGSPIGVLGEVTVQLAIPDIRRTFPWTFIVGEVTKPILGIDFLSANNLIIDCSHKTLIDATTNVKAVLRSSSEKPLSLSINKCGVHYKAHYLLDKYPALLKPLQPNIQLPQDLKVEHRIDTGNNLPVFCRPRPLTGTKLQAAIEEFKSLQSSGIVRRSNSPWASPLHMVPKADKSWRPCGDYRKLNNITVSDKYPLPHLKNLTMSFHGKKIFSKLDLQRAYLQVPVAEEDIPKTAICTPFGSFEFLKMPFGLKNAGATFQRYMDSIFDNLDNVYVYLDDLIVASINESEHQKDLENVFRILSKNCLRISIDKCTFYKNSVKFLGYQISEYGVSPPIDRIEAISNFPEPKGSHELRRFMGMLNFFRQMIPSFATIAYPLTEMLKNNPNCKNLQWCNETRDSFTKLKQALASCHTLLYPDPHSDQYEIVTDSSAYAIGAALYQLVDTVPKPISFFSKKLTDTQKTYSTYDRELLGIYLAIHQFKHIIDGHSVTVFTDHKPIVSAFISKNSAKSDKQQRQLSFISEYVHSVQHIKGYNNVVADCLSRDVCAARADIFDIPGLAESQKTDLEILDFKDRLTEFRISEESSILCDNSMPSPRPFVPKSARTSIIDMLHKVSHPGIKTTSKLVKQRYFWPSMDNEIKEFVRNCRNCQQAKVHRHTHSPVEIISAPTDRLHTIHIDIVGPLPAAKLPNYSFNMPFSYVLTCIDRATRWAEAIPLVDITAVSVAIALVSGWVSRYGVPLEIVTDRGKQFEAELFSNLADILGFHHMRTTSYHPQSNGIIERLHRVIKGAIMARKDNWYVSLPIVMLGIRMSPSNHGFSPFTALTGTHLLCPHPIFNDNSKVIETNNETLKLFIKEMAQIDFTSHSKGQGKSPAKYYIPSDLKHCPEVWVRVDRVRKSLEAPYTGPHKVLKRYAKYFVLDLPHGEQSVSIDRLKPVFPFGTSSEPNTHSDMSEATPVSEPLQIMPQQPVSNLDTPNLTRSGRKIKFNNRPDYYYYD